MSTLSPKNLPLSIAVLGKEYQVACPEEEQQGLLAAAAHLDKQMRQIRDHGKVIGLERIAIMTALNLSYELLQQKQQLQHANDDSTQLARLQEKIDNALLHLKS